MPTTSVEDEVARPVTASCDVAAKPHRTSLNKLFRRASASSSGKSAKLHRVPTKGDCGSEPVCYFAPAEASSVRLISVRRRDPDEDFYFSVPPKRADETLVGCQTAARNSGDGVAQWHNGRMENANGPSSVAGVTEVKVVTGEVVDGDATVIGKGGLTGEEASPSGTCAIEVRLQPTAEEAHEEAQDQPGIMKTHEETSESHTEVGVNGLTTTSSSSAVTETTQEDKDGSVVVRKVTITRNTIVSSQQGAPEPSRDGENEEDGVSAQIGQTSESIPVVVIVSESEPTDNSTDATPEVVSHSTVEVTSSELQEGDERNSVHVQEEKVQKSETLESKSEEGNFSVENKQEIKEVVTVRKIVTKETVPIEWPKTENGQSETSPVEQSEQENGETPTSTEVEVKVEVVSAPVEETTPAAEAAEEKLPEGDKDKEPEDKDKTDDEHVDDGKSDLTSEEGTLERGSKSKDGKLSPSKRILAFFKRKSHKSKKKDAASDQDNPEKEDGDETPTDDPEVQEEQISAVDAKRDNTVPSFPAEPASAPDSPVEEPSSPDDSLMKEPTPCGSSSPRKDDVSGGSPSPLESPSSCEHQEIILTADNPKSFTMTDEKPSKPKKQPATSPGFFARASQLLAPLHSPPNSPNESFEGAITRSSRSSMDSGTSSDPNRHTGHFVVVAIDFGTTFSGYAFSFTRDPESIHMMRKWEGGDPGVINQKTPTCLLLTPDGEFKAFGFTARDLYHDLDPVEAEQWLYFEKFKMVLHYSADLNKDTMLEAVNGKSMPALTIFSYALRFFKEHALQELSDQSSTKILNEDVRWVITVPAIWKAPAKQFMRQAAYDAGISTPEYPDQLLIALEPEAASIYVRRLRLYQLVPEKPSKRPLTPRKSGTIPEPMNMDKVSDELGTGTKYMLVDCGGGTVDITVHEMESHGRLKELYKATGGPYGSVGVELEFEKLLVNIFGSEFIEAFRHKRPAGWVDLMIAFESRKRAATPFKNNALNVSLPFSFIDYYKKKKGSQVESAIRKYGDKDIRWSSQGMLRLMPEAMQRLFMPTLEKIKTAIGDVLNNPYVKDTEYLFLVGGFAESQVLQLHLRREFGHLVKIIIPQDVSLTILKGAVCYGLDPTVVSVRWSRLTYGVGVLNRFVGSKHPKKKLVKKDGVEWCTDVFDKYVGVNQPIALGDSVLRSYTPAKSGQKSSIINIYCTDRSDVHFITDKGVKKVGTLCLDLSDIQYQQSLPRRREIQTRMVFGDTEIKLSALDVSTGKCVRCNVDFLNK